MTDQTLWVKYKIQPDRINRGQTEAYRKASPSDLLADLLKAVEEGTIEGGFGWHCVHGNAICKTVTPQLRTKGDEAAGHHAPCGPTVVVPVSEEPNQ